MLGRITCEYIVSYSYNVAINGERDMHSERMSVMARKYTIGHKGNLSDKFWEKLNHISATEILSLIIQIWTCSQSRNGFESKGL